MDMPWGKFAGRPLDKVPFFYVRWLLEQPWLDGELRDALCEELGRRFPDPEPTAAAPPHDVFDVD